MPNFLFFFIIIYLYATSCVSDPPPPTIEVNSEPILISEPQTLAQKLQSLYTIAPPQSRHLRIVKDVEYILLASIHEQRNEHEKALQQWFEALKVARGFAGSIAFQGWLLSYLKKLNRLETAERICELVLTETNQGQISPYMTDQGLNNKDLLITHIKKIASGQIRAEQLKPSPQLTTGIIWPKTGLPADDPLLQKTAEHLCKNPEQLSDLNYLHWKKTLPVSIARYLDASVNFCNKQPKKAATMFETVYPRLKAKKQTIGMALVAANKMIQYYRNESNRPQMTIWYLKLVEVWQNSALNAKDFNEPEHEFRLMRINDTLWAARYLALHGDYKTATRFSKDALQLINNFYGGLKQQIQKFEKERLDYLAESYHVLASRIALEQKDYRSAEVFTKTALNVPGLSIEWRDRFHWFLGLYYFLAGDLLAAKDQWLGMLKFEDLDKIYKPQLYFWLAYVSQQLKHNDDRDVFLEQLIEDHPMSFYSIVAVKESGLDQSAAVKTVALEKLNELSQTYQERNDFDLDNIRSDEIGGNLLLRAEILTAANLADYARLALKEFGTHLRKRFIVEKAVPAFVYLSRLFYKVSDYYNALNISSFLEDNIPDFWQQWPDQIFVHFPKPHLELYRQYAIKFNQDIELLYAISRQESRFDSAAFSSAGAIGLMQLIPVTAKRMANQLKLNSPYIEKVLQEPATNIMLGTKYLETLKHHYQGDLLYLVAAYNAGEQAVDAWIKRRLYTHRLIWLELIPFGETKSYVKNVWKNVYIYRHLVQNLTMAQESLEKANH